MTPPVSLVAAPAAGTDDEFELDMRFIEAAVPLAVMMCDTDDTCGETCSTSACNSNSYELL
jgi:FxLD family lantipeptide